jgi:dephospho-CoA kinase
MKKSRPKIIGITGGIGSGKTTVAKYFEELGFPLYNSDTKAKDIQNNNPDVIKQIKNLFGENSYTENGLNRPFIAKEVFNHKEKLKQLNAIVHPAVFKDFEQWINQQSSAYILKEAAILIESGSYKDCDLIISVIADTEIKIKRVQQRDNFTREEILARMKNQLNDQDRIKYSDYIIENNYDLELLRKEVEKIAKEIKNNSNFED